MRVHIGTSGWHYKHWLGRFYPAALPAPRMFDYYLRFFDTVELNNSFYRLPTVETFAAWRDAAPSKFLFAVKASRFLTHNKKLKDPEQALQNLLPRAEVLGKKLGPILFQLPPKWSVNAERLETFLQTLPPQRRYAFEFRDPTWFTDDVYGILRKYNAAQCVYELAGFHSPLLLTASFGYVRLHGPGGKYQGTYTHEALRRWADQLVAWSPKLRDVYVYFDNDDSGFAAHNALLLKELSSKAGLL